MFFSQFTIFYIFILVDNTYRQNRAIQGLLEKNAIII